MEEQKWEIGYFFTNVKSDLKNYQKYNLVPIGKPFGSVNPIIKKNELSVTGPMITKGYMVKSLNKGKFILLKIIVF